ncbi:unnamed protein product [marine sediment metagenome]|uniref:Uncharacterized protein n=1 Tax=marine sediment metagenome TaxID=412755 RepID=X1AD04_9ZZZZ
MLIGNHNDSKAKQAQFKKDIDNCLDSETIKDECPEIQKYKNNFQKLEAEIDKIISDGEQKRSWERLLQELPEIKRLIGDYSRSKHRQAQFKKDIDSRLDSETIKDECPEIQKYKNNLQKLEAEIDRIIGHANKKKPSAFRDDRKTSKKKPLPWRLLRELPKIKMLIGNHNDSKAKQAQFKKDIDNCLDSETIKDECPEIQKYKNNFQKLEAEIDKIISDGEQKRSWERLLQELPEIKRLIGDYSRSKENITDSDILSWMEEHDKKAFDNYSKFSESFDRNIHIEFRDRTGDRTIKTIKF